jgi:hypothetical protein
MSSRREKGAYNTKRFHAWVHYDASPADKDDMQCQNFEVALAI